MRPAGYLPSLWMARTGAAHGISSCTNELALQIQTLYYKQQICDNVYSGGNCLDKFGQSNMGLSTSMDYPTFLV